MPTSWCRLEGRWGYRTFCALVTTASKRGDAQLLAEVLEGAQAANACNVAVCNAAIEAFGKLNDAQVIHIGKIKIRVMGDVSFALVCRKATVGG